MITKTVLAVSLAAVFVVSMTITSAAFAAGGNYLNLVSSSFAGNSATITTEDSVNRGMPGAYGYGIIAGNGVVAITTHAGGDDSARQHNANQPSFHVHLVGPAAASINDCPSGAPLKVSTISDLGATLKIRDTRIGLTNIDIVESGTLTGPTLSFKLSFEGSNVCITPVSLLS